MIIQSTGKMKKRQNQKKEKKDTKSAKLLN